MIAVIVLIIGGIVYLAFFYGKGDVESLALGFDNQNDSENLVVNVRATTPGWTDLDDDCTIEIFLNGVSEAIYQTETSVKGDSGSIEIPYTDFLMGNGIYSIKASMGGKTDEASFTETRIAEIFDFKHPVSLADDMTLGKPGYRIEINVDGMRDINGTMKTPGEGGDYSVDLRVTTPSGSTVDMNSRESLSQLLDHDTAGTYRVRGKLTNHLCSADSPYRELEINESFITDTHPFADAGDDIQGEANTTITFDGSASWDDGGTENLLYRWYFDDGTTPYEAAGDPSANHIYEEAGDYIVKLEVIDEKGQSSENRGMGLTGSMLQLTETIYVTIE